jgi:hypothetical protein
MNYPMIFQELKAVVTSVVKHLKLLPTSKIGRPRSISVIEATTLALYQHRSTRITKKSIYDDFSNQLNCSYKTLVVSMNDSAMLALRILFFIMRLGKKNQHLIKYTDATDIPVCLKKNADSHKTMKELSSFGRSSKGWYYGLKMTITRDFDGKLLAVKFSRASKDDRKIFREINKEIKGIIIADAGYVSKELEKDMNIEGIRWILIRPYKTMKKLMTKWQEKLYQGRFQIEFDFKDMKMFHGLITSLPRSIKGYLANYIHTLVSFVLS